MWVLVHRGAVCSDVGYLGEWRSYGEVDLELRRRFNGVAPGASDTLIEEQVSVFQVRENLLAKIRR